MVSIAAFQAVDPGSIPGRRISFLAKLLNIYGIKKSMLFHLIHSLSGT